LSNLLLALAWRLALAIVTVGATGWGALALHFRGPESAILRYALIGAWVLAGIACLIAWLLPRGPQFVWLGSGLFVVAIVMLAFWWHGIQPRQDRDWAPDVARLLEARIDGDSVTLHNVRNFEWRTREDFDARWETRGYDLSQLRTADLVVSYWGGPAIAHTLVSFGFADGRHLVFSVEVRRTRGQQFSAIGGFFRQSELVLVAADERDIVRTRSNVRGEQVYLYRVAMPRQDLRSLFEAYVRETHRLQRKPRFYNTLLSNCTTIVYDMVKRIVPGLPWDHRLLLSGYLPDYIYDLGALDTRLAFDKLKRRGHINTRANASDINGHSSPYFSQAIRANLPVPESQARD